MTILVALRETLADLEHARWSRWQRYMHSKCVQHADGSLTIPTYLVAGWERQILTTYDKLSESEKDSDRKEADVTLAAIGRWFSQGPPQDEELIE